MTQIKALPLLVLLPLACAGCSVADRVGQDLETAAGNITHPGAWLRDEFSGPAGSPPITEGHSPAVGHSTPPGTTLQQ